MGYNDYSLKLGYPVQSNGNNKLSENQNNNLSNNDEAIFENYSMNVDDTFVPIV